MFLSCSVHDPAQSLSPILSDGLSDVPWQHVPREIRLLLCRIDGGFPAPAADDLEEPIDLASLLVEHPAASYV